MKKTANILTVILFAGILFSLSVAFWILPDRTFSDEENRSLRSLPAFSWENLFSGELSENMNRYFEDQFPFRNGFVGVKAYSELLLGKGENNGILIGKDGQVARRMFSAVSADGKPFSADVDTFDEDLIRASADGILRLQANAPCPVTVALPGRSIDIAASAFSYPSIESERLLTVLSELLGDSDAYCDVNTPLKTAYENGQYVTYKTDHHWTTRGAYLAYRELMKSFGMEEDILPESNFEIETASENFLGTSYSASGFKFLSPDKIELWHARNESDFEITADGKKLDGFYNRSYLDKKDQYSTFLDGTHDVVTVKKAGEERPVLLLAKDSFANCMVPFLAQHFDLVILNLSSARNRYTNLSQLAKEYQTDRILILYNLENVITYNRLTRLE